MFRLFRPGLCEEDLELFRLEDGFVLLFADLVLAEDDLEFFADAGGEREDGGREGMIGGKSDGVDFRADVKDGCEEGWHVVGWRREQEECVWG
jgi:hypothetical protein